MNYDNEISDLKKAISIRRKNLEGLQSMNTDAESARELTKVQHVTHYSIQFPIVRLSCRIKR